MRLASHESKLDGRDLSHQELHCMLLGIEHQPPLDHANEIALPRTFGARERALRAPSRPGFVSSRPSSLSLSPTRYLHVSRSERLEPNQSTYFRHACISVGNVRSLAGTALSFFRPVLSSGYLVDARHHHIMT